MLRTVLVVACIMGAGADRYHPAKAWLRAGSKSDESQAQFWTVQAQEALRDRVRAVEPTGKARNVVLFMGDGMSVPTLTAARILLGQRAGGTGEEAQMSFENFPTTGLAKTYCVNSQIADSACTATAYLCGAKTNYGILGVSAAVPRGDCEASTTEANHIESIAEWAFADGRDIGFVTTTRVTHASPSGLYAKIAERDWETDANVKESGYNNNTCPDITHQLVIFGGGRRTFLPTNVNDELGNAGSRTDGRNLIEEWQQDKANRNVNYNYIWNRQQLMNLNDNPPEYLLGLFGTSHMAYNLEANLETQPTLTELTETAIKMLSRNEKGFFLFVEGGRIDHGHHDNLVHKSLDETIEMHKAVARATELLSKEDSLIVVTADHSHVMAFNGYSNRGWPILGASRDLDKHDQPYMTLSYTNGPSFRPHVNEIRPDVTAEENYFPGNPTWASHTDIPLEWDTHGGEDVAVFAWGTRHSLFTGLYEQHHIPHLMAYVGCFGPGEHACSHAATQLPLPLTLAAALISLLFLRRS